MDWISAIAPEPDQPLVVSVACVRSDDGWTVMHGSALFVSPPCADVSWGVWRQDAFTPRPESLPSGFWLELGDLALGRAVLDHQRGADWVHAVDASINGSLDPVGIELPALDGIPALAARLSEPAATQIVCLNTDIGAAQLASSAGRAMRAVMLGSDQDGALDVPAYVEDGDWTTTAPGRDLIGMNLWDGTTSEVPKGLLIGATDERLWVWAMRSEDDLRRVNLDFEWNLSRVDLLDLNITHEQWLADALVSSQVTQVHEIAGIRAHRGSSIRLSFDSIGSRSKHEFAIRDSAGALLDRVGPYGFVERIELVMSVNGAPSRPITPGTQREIPTFSDRARRQGEIRDADQAMVGQAVAERFIAGRAQALQRLREEIERAHGELLVIDPYFGQRDLSEWRLLDGVRVPVRVVAKKQFAAGAQLGDNVRARRIPGADMHDRHYLWDGGGLRVGGSPSTFGHAPISFDRIPSSEVPHLRSLFEGHWLDARAVDYVP